MGNEKLTSNLTHLIFQESNPSMLILNHIQKHSKESIDRLMTLILQHGIIVNALSSPRRDTKKGAKISHFKLVFLIMSTLSTRLTSFSIRYSCLIDWFFSTDLLKLKKNLSTFTPHAIFDQDTHSSNKIQTATSFAQQDNLSKALATSFDLSLANPSKEANKALLNQHFASSASIPNSIPD